MRETLLSDSIPQACTVLVSPPVGGVWIYGSLCGYLDRFIVMAGWVFGNVSDAKEPFPISLAFGRK